MPRNPPTNPPATSPVRVSDSGIRRLAERLLRACPGDDLCLTLASSPSGITVLAVERIPVT